MPIIGGVIAMEGEKNGIPVEVAMIYNDSYTRTYTLTSIISTLPKGELTYKASVWGSLVPLKPYDR